MDSISIRPPQSRASAADQNDTASEQSDSNRKAERQRAFAVRAGKEISSGSPADQNNKRQLNLLGGAERESSAPTADFTFMYGMAVVWDVVTFLVGLIPVAGWVLNLVVFFPIGLFNMYIMAQSRGKSTMQFWGGFKYIFIEAIPYLNIIPTFVRGVYLIKNEGKTTGLAGAVNTLNKTSVK
jgi:hypothetical protein